MDTKSSISQEPAFPNPYPASSLQSQPQHSPIPQQHHPATCISNLASAITSSPHFLRLQYLAEGNANVIYTIHPQPHPPTHPDSNPHPTQPLAYSDAYTQTHPPSGCSTTQAQQIIAAHAGCAVLRLRKDLPFTFPVKEVLDGFERKIKPLFTPRHEDVLLEQRLVKLSEGMVREADSLLREMETDVGQRNGQGVEFGVVEEGEVTVLTEDAMAPRGNASHGEIRKIRPLARRGAYLPDIFEERYGILMPNLLTLGREHQHRAEPAFSSESLEKHSENTTDTTISVNSSQNPQSRPQGEPRTRLIEFKAKWLTQSPSVPSKAMRCRTCAVNISRRAERAGLKKKKGRGDSGFCPFALLSDDREVLGAALGKMGLFNNTNQADLDRVTAPSGEGEAERELGNEIEGDTDGQAKGRKASLLRTSEQKKTSLHKDFVQNVQPILWHLQSLQNKYNCVGLEDFRGAPTPHGDGKARDGPEEKDFSVAMALRDCSVFLVLGDDDANTPERDEVIQAVKLADLDLKTTTGGKIERWAGIEEGLIEGGWYTTANLEGEGMVDGEETYPCYWTEQVVSG